MTAAVFLLRPGVSACEAEYGLLGVAPELGDGAGNRASEAVVGRLREVAKLLQVNEPVTARSVAKEHRSSSLGLNRAQCGGFGVGCSGSAVEMRAKDSRVAQRLESALSSPRIEVEVVASSLIAYLGGSNVVHLPPAVLEVVVSGAPSPCRP
jgi:hypothetical protein